MSSETNVQLFPGVFRTTQGGATNPDFFLHSSGRVGIGNRAPDTPPAWNANTTFKLNVTGHTHINGNLDVTGYLYGDGSTLSGVAAVVGGYWDLDQANNNIKYDVGNVGIGGVAGTEKLTVHGDLNLNGGNLKLNGEPFAGSPWTTTGDNLTYTTGNVAIGTTSTARKLTVDDSIRLTDGTVNIDMSTSQGTLMAQQAKIQASDLQQGDNFGNSVSISRDGNTAIVGAKLEDTQFTSAGAAYIFTRSGSTWSEQAKIQSSDVQQNDFFAGAVSISGDGNTAIVSAHAEDTTADTAGSAYIFFRSGSTWTQQAKIQSSDVELGDVFSWSVSLSGDGNTAIVGAPNEDTVATSAGSAYIFFRSGSTWTQQAKIQASDAAASVNFGYSVSISEDGNTAIVGAYLEDTVATNAGAAYIFTRSGNTWSEQQKIQASDVQALDQFGVSVSISKDGGTAIVGAQYKDTGFSDAGAAYIFQQEYDKLVVSGDILARGTVLSFTGQHRCFPEGPIERGLIVSANRNKYMNLNGPLTTGIGAIQSTESLPIVSLSNVVNDTRVFGVIDKPELITLERRQKYGNILVRNDKEYGDVRVIINSLGEGAMWIVNTNGNVVSGDYITSSNISGYGQKQDDDILHSYTVAKITMDCDFNPEEIPVQVIKKDENNINILDEYGRLQWEDTDKTQKAYNIKYLTTNGKVTDEANAIWTAAYVGCTYHCG